MHVVCWNCGNWYDMGLRHWQCPHALVFPNVMPLVPVSEVPKEERSYHPPYHDEEHDDADHPRE